MEPLMTGTHVGQGCADASEILNEDSNSHARDTLMATNIMAELMRFRRLSGSETACSASYCPKCSEPHLSKIVAKVEQEQPVTFVLPAFPGKSPNPAKVLGPLPDMAERRALEFLQELCDRIGRHYSPGARIILCSDGRVFSDAVGMRDEDVTAYRDGLTDMIAELGLTSISTYNLEELYEGLSFDDMRRRLMEEYGEPLDVFRASVKRGGNDPNGSVEDKEAHRLYCGITRFLVEDATVPGQNQSRSAIQKDARARAYEVVRKSQAWSELIERNFPQAVRLSIHPQSCGAKKMGIHLVEPVEADNWLTPWHGVAVEVGGRFVLSKRSQAEARGARLVTQSGRPSHFVLNEVEAHA